MERERAVWKSIVALLFALADLAERASGRSARVCRTVLWILRPAEAFARDLIVGAADDAPGVAALEVDGAAEALRLAQSFRVLAMTLDYCLQIDAQAAPAFFLRVRRAGKDWLSSQNRSPTPLPGRWRIFFRDFVATWRGWQNRLALKPAGPRQSSLNEADI